MLQHAIIRLALAAYLAIASPALCCCGLRALVDRMLGEPARSCHQELCCALVDRHVADLAGREAEPSAGGRCGAWAGRSEPGDSNDRGDDRPCRCHERDTLVIRADGPSAAMAAGVSPAPLVLAVPPALLAGNASCGWLVIAGRGINLDLPPPTLLRQRCMLLI